MATAPHPSPVHDRALDVIARCLGRTPDQDARLGDLGCEVAASVLYALECEFGVLIEADLVYPNATLGDVAEYAAALGRLKQVFSNDTPDRVVQFSEWRARRAPGEVAPAAPLPIDKAAAERSRRIMGLFAWTAVAAGAFAAIAFAVLTAGHPS